MVFLHQTTLHICHAFASLDKGYFIWAMLHAFFVRNVCMLHSGNKTRWEIATGAPFNLDAIRIFGANMYGTLVPEQRKQMNFDKADPRSV